MACYNPLKAYKTADGGVVFSELKRHHTSDSIELPCGQCIGCRLERSRQWAMRCVHEASMYEHNSFVTLTYDEDNLPNRGQLRYDHWQNFAKRLRKQIEPSRVRFFMCGEYGEENGRPHYHACLFGHDWEDKKYHMTTNAGEKLYTSESLDKLWGHGLCSTGDVTFASAGYVARYVLKKITGDAAEEHYRRFDELGHYQLEPEFCGMSLKPGLGEHGTESTKTT